MATLFFVTGEPVEVRRDSAAAEVAAAVAGRHVVAHDFGWYPVPEYPVNPIRAPILDAAGAQCLIDWLDLFSGVDERDAQLANYLYWRAIDMGDAPQNVDVRAMVSDVADAYGALDVDDDQLAYAVFRGLRNGAVRQLRAIDTDAARKLIALIN